MSRDLNNNANYNYSYPRVNSGRFRRPPQSLRFSQNLTFYPEGSCYLNRFRLPEDVGSAHPFGYRNYSYPGLHHRRSLHWSPQANHSAWGEDVASGGWGSESQTQTYNYNPRWRSGPGRSSFQRPHPFQMEIPEDFRFASSSSDSNSSISGFNSDVVENWAPGGPRGRGGSNVSPMEEDSSSQGYPPQDQAEVVPCRQPNQSDQMSEFNSRKRHVETDQSMEVVTEPSVSESAQGPGPSGMAPGDNQQDTQELMEIDDGSSAVGYFQEAKRSRYGNPMFYPPRGGYRRTSGRQETVTKEEKGEGGAQAIQPTNDPEPQPSQHVGGTPTPRVQAPPKVRNFRRYYEPSPEPERRNAQPRQQSSHNRPYRKKSDMLKLIGDEVMAIPKANFNSGHGEGGCEGKVHA